MDFNELSKKDAEAALKDELEYLKTTIPVDLKAAAGEYEKMDDDFIGFQKLFDKFLSDSQFGIDWNSIEKLPANSVSTFDGNISNKISPQNKKWTTFYKFLYFHTLDNSVW